MKTHRFLAFVATWAISLLGTVWQTSALAAVIVIDDFISVQTAAVEALAPPIQSAGSSLNPAVGVIGAERDLYVEKTSGSDGERVRARINPNGETLLRQTIDDARGRVVITWDGIDGLFQPTQVKYNGLGGIDFTKALQLDLLVTLSDVGGPVRFIFWDAADLTGGTFASTTFAVPGGIPSGSSVLLSKTFLNPSDFVATGGTLSGIFSNVGAIQMEIDASAVAQEAWDARFDFVRATGNPVPEPGTLALLGLGLAGLAATRRRKQ